MDLDRYLSVHRPSWDRLRSLSSQVRQRPAALSPTEIDEFVSLHNRVSGQLSFVRGRYRDPGLTAELNTLVANSNAALYKRTASPGTSIRRFFSVSFPAAVWHMRRFVLASALFLFIPWIAIAVWLGNDPNALDVAIDPEARAALVESQFEDYYSSAPAAEFATSVLTNNIRVAFVAYALGVCFGAGTAYILAFNGFGIGASHGVFVAAGQQSKFFGLIIPHGLLELSSVIIAGAAGMSMGWALIRPGDRTRAEAFGQEARRSVAVVLGLILAFVVAGLIEGYITPGLPLWPRITVGTVVFAAFTLYIVAFGRRAELNGFTGLVSEVEEHASAHTALTI